MRVIHLICVTALLYLASCKKKEKPAEDETPPPPDVVAADPGPECEDLPPAPIPFGWYDTIVDKNKSINAFLFDPVDPDKIIFVVNGDAFGYNKVYSYHVPSKQANYVCTLGDYLPQVNRKGWVTFSDVDNNVFLVKGNSNQVIQLTTNKHNHNPRWDHTGNYIYYFSEAYGTIGAQMVKIDTAGLLNNILELEVPYFASFRTSEKMLFLKITNTLCTIILRDLNHPENDRTLLTGPLYSKTGEFNFDDLTLDNTDENFFWSNPAGIFRCNIASLKVDTLLKNCPNLIHRNPIVSLNANELTYSQEVITPLNTLRLFHQFRAMEMNLYTAQSVEIKIYP